MPAISSFRRIENKHDVYIGKYCMKNFCESLRGHAMEIINSEKKKKEFLNKKKQHESYQNAKICYICKEKFENKNKKNNKNMVKLYIIVIIQGNIEVLHIAYVI